MAKHIFQEDGDKPASKAGVTAGLFAAGAFLLLILSWVTYSMFRIDVGADQFAVLTRKTGKDLKNDDEVAPTSEHKGVQKQVLTTGRYFYDPFNWSSVVKPQIDIKPGRMGVLVSLTGEDLPYGEFLAVMNGPFDAKTKGIVPDVLKPGRYPINPYLFRIEEEHEPITIPAGFKGVVTNLAGPFPKEPNKLLVQKGERGVQEETLDAGTYFVNPYVTRISKIDCRSQRFNLAEKKDMGFPSKDGFWVSLDGRIEFRINPTKAAEVFVTYNEDTNGDAIDEEIIRKVILPNARSICRSEGSSKLGREFIEGVSALEFEKKFEAAMQGNCDPLGVEIIQAVITSIHPPSQLATPINLRTTAKLDESKFKQQILQQEQEEKLAEQSELVKQKAALVSVNKQIVKVTTEAEREQEIEVTQANQELAVAKLKLEAAKDEAAAIIAKGEAEAEVVQQQNAAEAAGWKRSVDAFNGNGAQFAQYVLFQKLSAAYRRVMVNTADSPIMKIFDSFNEPVKDTVRGQGSEVRGQKE
jgi:regulator of protease activity HflC (stomatin/prohibitin superfamily)